MEQSTETQDVNANPQNDAAPTDTSPQEAQAAPTQTTPDWVPKRMGELAAARRAAEERAVQEAARAARMEEELNRMRAANGSDDTSHQQTYDPRAIEDLARTYAEQIAGQRFKQEAMAKRISEVETAGRKEYGQDFDNACNNLALAGVGGQEFLEVATSIPNAEKAITWLGKPENVGEAIRIASLPPVQMGIEMMQLANKASKELSKSISKAPPPLSTIDGGSSGASGAEPALGTPEWFEYRNKNARRNRR